MAPAGSRRKWQSSWKRQAGPAPNSGCGYRLPTTLSGHDGSRMLHKRSIYSHNTPSPSASRSWMWRRGRRIEPVTMTAWQSRRMDTVGRKSRGDGQAASNSCSRITHRTLQSCMRRIPDALRHGCANGAGAQRDPRGSDDGHAGGPVLHLAAALGPKKPVGVRRLGVQNVHLPSCLWSRPASKSPVKSEAT